MKFASIGSVVSEENMLENIDIHTNIHAYTHTHTHIHKLTHTHTHTHIHKVFLYYQLTYEPKESGELKMSFFQRKEFIFSEHGEGTRILNGELNCRPCP